MINRLLLDSGEDTVQFIQGIVGDLEGALAGLRVPDTDVGTKALRQINFQVLDVGIGLFCCGFLFPGRYRPGVQPGLAIQSK